MCRERAKSETFRSLIRKEVTMRDIVVINKKYNTKVENLNKAKKEKMMSFILNTATYRKN